MHPITQPAAVDGVFITMATADRKVWVEALDASSGAVVWRKESRASSVLPYIVPLGFEHDAKNVYFLAPSDVGGEPFATVQAVAARTGQAVWHSTTARMYADTPHKCPGDEAALCLVETLDDKHSDLVRMGMADGTDQTLPTAVSYYMGAGLYSGRDGDGHPILASSPENKPGTWTDNVVGLFPGAYAGYDFVFDDKHKLVLGHWGIAAGFYQGDTVALSADSGKRLWSAPNAISGCSDSLPSFVDSGGVLLCRYHQVAGAKDPDDAVVEALDPVSGHILWTFDAGNALHDSLGDHTSQVGEHEWLITDATGHQTVLNVTTGKTRPAASRRDIGWCMKGGDSYPLDTGDPTNGGGYKPERTVYPCTPDGVSTKALPAFVPLAVNDAIGKVFAWSDGQAIHTARHT
jgi:outer membrane protein assembly factor BamB